jgi:hypothetical protein
VEQRQKTNDNREEYSRHGQHPHRERHWIHWKVPYFGEISGSLPSCRRQALRKQLEVARKLWLTRARVTQPLDLMLLAPDLQEQLIDLEAVDGVKPGLQNHDTVGASCMPLARTESKAQARLRTQLGYRG